MRFSRSHLSCQELCDSESVEGAFEVGRGFGAKAALLGLFVEAAVVREVLGVAFLALLAREVGFALVGVGFAAGGAPDGTHDAARIGRAFAAVGAPDVSVVVVSAAARGFLA